MQHARSVYKIQNMMKNPRVECYWTFFCAKDVSKEWWNCESFLVSNKELFISSSARLIIAGQWKLSACTYIRPGNTKGGSITVLFYWFWLVCFANKTKNCQLSYRWFQTSQMGGQQYSDTSPFSIPWSDHSFHTILENRQQKHLFIHYFLGCCPLSWFHFSSSPNHQSRGQCYKTFLSVIYQWMFLISQSVCPW